MENWSDVKKSIIIYEKFHFCLNAWNRQTSESIATGNTPVRFS